MLTWDWNKKLGYVIETNKDTGDKIRLELYKGNAHLIALYEDNENDTYQMAWFFADEEHMKNCIKDDIFYMIQRFEFHFTTESKSTKKIAQSIIKHMYGEYEITIEMLPW